MARYVCVSAKRHIHAGICSLRLQPDKEEPVDGESVHALAVAMMREEIMTQMMAHFKVVDFETRRGVASVFVYLLRHDVAGITEYMQHHAALLYQMVDA
jgi:hypothetical protein